MGGDIRVPSLDFDGLVSHFLANDSAERASRLAIALTPAVLQRYVGRYPLNPNVTLTVRLEGDTLLLNTGRGAPFHLVPSSVSGFFLKEALTRVVFDTTASGRATALTMIHAGLAPAGDEGQSLTRQALAAEGFADAEAPLQEQRRIPELRHLPADRRGWPRPLVAPTGGWQFGPDSRVY